MRITRLAVASLGLTALSFFGDVAEAQDVKPPVTLWTFLGFPPKGAVKDHLANRNGNHPGLERKPPRLAIADPKNLKSPVPAIKKAAEVKTQEDLAPQKIKAIKYLASIGCGCYNRDGSITDALLAALDDCTETVRLAAADAISATAGDVCQNCNQQSCCTKEIHDRLMKMAYEMDKDGCWIEPSARVRGAAARALLACPPQDEVKDPNRELPPGERELPPGTEIIPPAPTPAPPAPMPGTSAIPTPAESQLTPESEETGKEEARLEDVRTHKAKIEAARKEFTPRGTAPKQIVPEESARRVAAPIERAPKAEVRAQETKVEEARPQPKSSRRTAKLGMLQATPVAAHRQVETETPASLPEVEETIQRLPPIVDASSMVAERPVAAMIVNKGTVEYIDLKQRLVVVRTSSEGQLPVGATVQASHRFLTGSAVVGQLKVVASEPGSATLQPINGMQVSKVAQGDQITVSR